MNLQLELSYNSPLAAAQSAQATTLPATTLHVQGLPKSMLDNPENLSEALKLFFKQTTGFEVCNCTIKHGAGFLTFMDPSGKCS